MLGLSLALALAPSSWPLTASQRTSGAWCASDVVPPRWNRFWRKFSDHRLPSAQWYGAERQIDGWLVPLVDVLVEAERAAADDAAAA